MHRWEILARKISRVFLRERTFLLHLVKPVGLKRKEEYLRGTWKCVRARGRILNYKTLNRAEDYVETITLLRGDIVYDFRDELYTLFRN